LLKFGAITGNGNQVLCEALAVLDHTTENKDQKIQIGLIKRGSEWKAVEVYILKEAFSPVSTRIRLGRSSSGAEPSRKRWRGQTGFPGTVRVDQMRERIASAIANRLYKHPGLIALVVVILVGLSGWQMSKLTINYNQLELIPQDLPSVLATKRMFKLAGGYGNLFVALGGKDVSQMKRVADDLTARS